MLVVFGVGALVLAPALRLRLERVADFRWRWAARVGWALQAVALVALVWLVDREGRGVIRDLVWPPAVPAAPSRAVPVAPEAVPDRLVLITIDTLRADRLCPATMPRTSAIASRGVQFTGAFSSAPWTLPALASLHTGRAAHAHGAGRPTGADPLSRSALAEGVPVLAETLRGAGFATRAIVTNPYLSLEYGLGRGFDAYENLSLETEALLSLQPTVAGWVWARLLPTGGLVDRGPVVTSRAERFLRSVGSDDRFFLWLHYVDPHAPYDGETRSFRGELLSSSRDETRLPSMARLRAGELRPDAAGRERLRRAYDSAVRAVDVEIGSVVDVLEERGLLSGTLLILTADHGEEFWEHGGVEHGHTLYDEVVRVPLLVWGPGIAPGRIDVPVGTDALAATALELLDVAVPAEMAPSLTGALRGHLGLPPRRIVSENLLFAEDRVALRTERHTYIRWPSGKEEVYDRASDPAERVDLAARVDLRRSLAATLDRERRATPPPPRAPGTSPRLRAALRALGYAQ